MYKAKEALGQFMVKGNKLRPPKVVCITLILFNLGSVCLYAFTYYQHSEIFYVLKLHIGLGSVFLICLLKVL